jgi:hypothetical protein
MESQDVRCATNMRMIGKAIRNYAADHGGALPDSLKSLIIGGYLDSSDIGVGLPQILVCPSSRAHNDLGKTKEEWAANADMGGAYVYVGKGVTIRDRADTPILYEANVRHMRAPGRKVMYLDGSLEWVPEQERTDR